MQIRTEKIVDIDWMRHVDHEVSISDQSENIARHDTSQSITETTAEGLATKDESFAARVEIGSFRPQPADVHASVFLFQERPSMSVPAQEKRFG